MTTQARKCNTPCLHDMYKLIVQPEIKGNYFFCCLFVGNEKTVSYTRCTIVKAISTCIKLLSDLNRQCS